MYPPLKNFGLLVACMAPLYALAGCSSPTRNVSVNYSVMIHNATLSDITGAYFYNGDGFNFGGGTMPAGTGQSFSFFPHPIAEKVNMTWVDGAGKTYEVVLDVLKSLPPRSAWDDTFTIEFVVSPGGQVNVMYADDGPDHRNSRHYSLAFRNTTSERVNQVVATFGNYQSAAGTVETEGAESYSYYLPDPIPEKGDVTWNDLQGVAHKTTVELAKALGPNPKRHKLIILTIQENGSVTAAYKADPP